MLTLLQAQLAAEEREQVLLENPELGRVWRTQCVQLAEAVLEWWKRVRAEEFVLAS